VVWVMIEELHTDGWHMGGLPFRGPASLMEQLGRAKATYESIGDNPTTRSEFTAVAPPLSTTCPQPTAIKASQNTYIARPLDVLNQEEP
jgi:hypothetical protein